MRNIRALAKLILVSKQAHELNECITDPKSQSDG